jgi:hypothetical protein
MKILRYGPKVDQLNTDAEGCRAEQKTAPEGVNYDKPPVQQQISAPGVVNGDRAPHKNGRHILPILKIALAL